MYVMTMYRRNKKPYIPDEVYVNRSHCTPKNDPVPPLWVVNSLSRGEETYYHKILASNGE